MSGTSALTIASNGTLAIIGGNVVVVAVTYGTGASDYSVTVADTVNTYTEIPLNQWQGTNHQGLRIFWTVANTTAALTITATISSSAPDRVLFATQFSGNLLLPYNTGNSGQGSTASPAPGNYTPKFDGSALYTVYIDTAGTNTPTKPTNFTLQNHNTAIADMADAWYIQPKGILINPTWTITSANWLCIGVAFSPLGVRSSYRRPAPFTPMR